MYVYVLGEYFNLNILGVILGCFTLVAINPTTPWLRNPSQCTKMRNGPGKSGPKSQDKATKTSFSPYVNMGYLYHNEVISLILLEKYLLSAAVQAVSDLLSNFVVFPSFFHCVFIFAFYIIYPRSKIRFFIFLFTLRGGGKRKKKVQKKKELLYSLRYCTPLVVFSCRKNEFSEFRLRVLEAVWWIIRV